MAELTNEFESIKFDLDRFVGCSNLLMLIVVD